MNVLSILRRTRAELLEKLQALDTAIVLIGGKVISSTPGKPTRGRRPSRGVSTRTAKERSDYDASILSYVEKSKGEISSREVRDACGGSPLQARKALNRLIETGSLTFSGQAAGTKYEVA